MKDMTTQERMASFDDYRKVLRQWTEVAIETDTGGELLSALAINTGMLIALADGDEKRKEALRLTIEQIAVSVKDYSKKADEFYSEYHK